MNITVFVQLLFKNMAEAAVHKNRLPLGHPGQPGAQDAISLLLI
jgi:hypothetical protein